MSDVFLVSCHNSPPPPWPPSSLLASLMNRKVSDGVRSPPRPCLPSDETEGNSKFESSLYFCRAGRRRAHRFLPHWLRCAEKRRKPKVKREGTFSSTSASLCPGPDVPQTLCPCVSTCSQHPRLQLRHGKSLEQHCPCAAPAQKPRLVGLSPSSHFPQQAWQEVSSLERANRGRKKSPTQLKKKKAKRGGCYPAMYS